MHYVKVGALELQSPKTTPIDTLFPLHLENILNPIILKKIFLIHINKIKMESGPIEICTPSQCKEHKADFLYYCSNQSCQKFICDSCFEELHQGHAIFPMQIYIKNLKKGAKVDLEKIDEILNMDQMQLTKLKKIAVNLNAYYVSLQNSYVFEITQYTNRLIFEVDNFMRIQEEKSMNLYCSYAKGIEERFKEIFPLKAQLVKILKSIDLYEKGDTSFSEAILQSSFFKAEKINALKSDNSNGIPCCSKIIDFQKECDVIIDSNDKEFSNFLRKLDENKFDRKHLSDKYDISNENIKVNANEKYYSISYKIIRNNIEMMKIEKNGLNNECRTLLSKIENLSEIKKSLLQEIELLKSSKNKKLNNLMSWEKIKEANKIKNNSALPEHCLLLLKIIENDKNFNTEGEFDEYGFYNQPDGSFYDPEGFYFNVNGYDEFGGFYDEEWGEYCDGDMFYEKEDLSLAERLDFFDDIFENDAFSPGLSW